MTKLLDLYCGAGGAAYGYSRAGFGDITGVDIKPQPHYPFRFVQADALEYLALHWQEYDAIHASPPCQAYSIMHNLPWLRGRLYPLLILPTLEMLEATGKPYMLENVMGARHGAKGLAKRGLAAHGLEAGWLCGQMFGLPFYRHRLFASNVFWLQPGHPKHRQVIRCSGTQGSRARDIVYSGAEDARGKASWPGRRNGAGNGLTIRQGVGHAKGWHLAAEAMGIDWMDGAELTQAIPPIYCEYVGRALLEAVANKGGVLRQ